MPRPAGSDVRDGRARPLIIPRFAANLSLLFTELPFLDRFDAAARAGFGAVEFLFPYRHDPAEIRRRLDANGLALALFNMPPGDRTKGDRGLAALPGRQGEFRESARRAFDYAHAIGGTLLHCMAGAITEDTSPAAAGATYAANLAWAGELARAEAVRIAIKPINHRDMPGYFLNTSEQAAAFVDAIGTDRLGLQFDVYHAQITQGDVTTRLARFMPIIAHMQIADVPGRNEPGTGEIGWDYVFRRIDELGYTGWVGCEYHPAGETVAGLGWRRRFAA